MSRPVEINEIQPARSDIFVRAHTSVPAANVGPVAAGFSGWYEREVI